MDLRYVREKLHAAIQSLAVGEGDVRSRLQSAWMCFHTLGPDDFPVELRSEFEAIVSALTDRRPPMVLANGTIYKGSVQTSLESMRNSTAAEIARRLWNLNEQVNALDA